MKDVVAPFDRVHYSQFVCFGMPTKILALKLMLPLIDWMYLLDTPRCWTNEQYLMPYENQEEEVKKAMLFEEEEDKEEEEEEE